MRSFIYCEKMSPWLFMIVVFLITSSTVFVTLGLFLWWVVGSFVPGAVIAVLFGLFAVGKYLLFGVPRDIRCVFLGGDFIVMDEARFVSADGVRQIRLCHGHSHLEILENGRVVSSHMSFAYFREGGNALAEVRPEVLGWIDVSKARRSMMVKHTIEGLPIRRPSRLQLVQGCEETSVYLMYFRESGGPITDTWHASIEGALAQGALEFEICNGDWTMNRKTVLASDRAEQTLGDSGGKNGLSTKGVISRMEYEIVVLNRTLREFQVEYAKAERWRGFGPMCVFILGVLVMVAIAVVSLKGMIVALCIDIFITLYVLYLTRQSDKVERLHAAMKLIEEQIGEIRREIDYEVAADGNSNANTSGSSADL